MSTKQITIHAIISGNVQGVFFRQATLEKATALKLTGWVKNTPNKTVELMASGDREAMSELTQWLWKGPPAANVTHVQVEEKPFKAFSTFCVKR